MGYTYYWRSNRHRQVSIQVISHVKGKNRRNRKYSGLKSFSLIGARYDFGAILLNFLHIIFSIIKSQMAYSGSHSYKVNLDT
jgi:hypothetical protein